MLTDPTLIDAARNLYPQWDGERCPDRLLLRDWVDENITIDVTAKELDDITDWILRALDDE